MKKKGFTLIELLAVIIILGILMLIAIPSVTNYINNSRKETYVDTVHELLKGASTLVNSGDLNTFDTDTTYYIPCSCIDTENGNLQSPYGKLDPAYVVVTYNGDGYNYYFTGKDAGNMGVPTITHSDLLTKESIVSTEEIDTDTGIAGTHTIAIFNNSCSDIATTKPITNTVSGDESSYGGQICSSSSAFTPTIYWALQDTDSDGVDDKLVISNSEVSGTRSGSFAGDTQFSSDVSVPWVTDDDLGAYVSEVVVEGVVAPVYTTNWFNGVGAGASSFHADLKNLNTCVTTDMSLMFYCAGQYADTVNLEISNWNTSKVTNMEYMFLYAGYDSTSFNMDISRWNTSSVTSFAYMFMYTGKSATTWSIGDLSRWNTSNVTNMSMTFYYTGHEATNWYIGDLSRWDVSNVTNMYYLFTYAGTQTQTFNLNLSGWDVSKVTSLADILACVGLNSTTFNLNVSGWNTSNVTDLSGMFDSAGYSASSFSLDLSSWDTSKVTNLYDVFAYAGHDATTFNLDISTWDTSKVTNMDRLFYDTGYWATSWNVKLPKTNGNGLSNTTSKFYGSSSSTSSSPPSGKSFTVAN